MIRSDELRKHPWKVTLLRFMWMLGWSGELLQGDINVKRHLQSLINIRDLDSMITLLDVPLNANSFKVLWNLNSKFAYDVQNPLPPLSYVVSWNSSKFMSVTGHSSYTICRLLFKMRFLVSSEATYASYLTFLCLYCKLKGHVSSTGQK